MSGVRSRAAPAEQRVERQTERDQHQRGDRLPGAVMSALATIQTMTSANTSGTSG